MTAVVRVSDVESLVAEILADSEAARAEAKSWHEIEHRNWRWDGDPKRFLAHVEARANSHERQMARSREHYASTLILVAHRLRTLIETKTVEE